MILVLTAASATLGANPRARELAKEADRFYKDNQYKEAAAKLKEAYALEPNPLFLYNIARALDQAGEVQQSLDAYRQYVGLPSDDTQPDLVKKANLAMDRLRTLAARSEADKSVRDAEKRRLEDEAAREKARAEREAEGARTQRQTYEAKEKAARDASQKTVDVKKIVALAAGGVGAASLLTSLIVGIVAVNSKASFARATTVADKLRFEADTKGQALATDLCLLVGLAAVTTAAILFPWGTLGDQAPVSLGLTPVPGGGVYGSLGVAF